MNLITVKPNLCQFNTCREFAEEFQLNEQDFILASKSTYLKHFASLDLQTNVVFRGDFGSGEPTDVMCEAIAAEAAKNNFVNFINISLLVSLSVYGEFCD